MKLNEKTVRILMAVLGVLVSGISVGFFKASLFGTDPFQCLMAGIFKIIPIGFGTLYVIVNVIMLVFMFIFGRKYIGVATFINIFLLGYVVEFAERTIHSIFGEADLMLRIAFLVVGMIVLCFAVSVYFVADLGVSTYDVVSLIMAEKGVGKFKYCRIGTDLICVGIGFSLGAIVGIGTLMVAFFMGPLIEVFRTKVAEPMLRHCQ